MLSPRTETLSLRSTPQSRHFTSSNKNSDEARLDYDTIHETFSTYICITYHNKILNSAFLKTLLFLKLITYYTSFGPLGNNDYNGFLRSTNNQTSNSRSQ